MAKLSVTVILTLLLLGNSAASPFPYHREGIKSSEIRSFRPRPNIPIEGPDDTTPEVSPEYPGSSRLEEEEEGTIEKKPPPPETGDPQITCEDNIDPECLPEPEDEDETYGYEAGEDAENLAALPNIIRGLLVGTLVTGGLLL